MADMPKMPDDIRNYSLSELCFEGLQTDGAHHKQWYLEQILKRVLGPEKYETLKDSYDWEEGIAP